MRVLVLNGSARADGGTKAMALLLCSGSRGVYEASECIYHGFIQGYYGVRDLGVFKATTEEAKSPAMAEQLATLGRAHEYRMGEQEAFR